MVGEAGIRIEQVRSAADMVAARALLVAYASSLDVDLAYQGFTEELARLPGDYARPDGALLLAHDRDDVPVACAALRRLDAKTCEMTRLYVDRSRRARGLGRRMAEAILDVAHELGFEEIRLDTLSTMREAQALYAALGFRKVPPYHDGAIEGTLFMGRSLGRAGGRNSASGK